MRKHLLSPGGLRQPYIHIRTQGASTIASSLTISIEGGSFSEPRDKASKRLSYVKPCPNARLSAYG
ncbi:MAG: hypothetical protein K2K75_11040 [Muribaculaceae bacterium]|nr:hypothetical protein [Muribaculaceae bacterium]